MRHFVVTVLFVLATINYSCLQSSSSSNSIVEVVTAEEMKELTQLEGVQLVDVRTPKEYEDGHISNAQNIDYMSPDFEKQIENLDKTKPIVVYCKKGGRSEKCAEKLEDAGFVKIYDFKGGVAKWKYNGFELESGKGTP